MIKIQKRTTNIPSELSTVKAADSLASITAKVQENTLTSKDFDDNIFGHRNVKIALKEDQHNKCAYCECSLVGDFGAVEHYRPKTEYQQSKESPKTTPSYYWLAYDWKNLLCSCDVCNSQKYKGNLFPLRDPATRDIANKNISNEIPLIINPAEEDPGEHIFFREHIAAAVSLGGIESDKGRYTLNIFGINDRKDLVQKRKNSWQIAEILLENFLSNGMSHEDAIKKVISLLGKNENDFAGMFIHQQRWPKK